MNVTYAQAFNLIGLMVEVEIDEQILALTEFQEGAGRPSVLRSK